MFGLWLLQLVNTILYPGKNPTFYSQCVDIRAVIVYDFLLAILSIDTYDNIGKVELYKFSYLMHLFK